MLSTPPQSPHRIVIWSVQHAIGLAEFRRRKSSREHPEKEMNGCKISAGVKMAQSRDDAFVWNRRVRKTAHSFLPR